MIEKKAGVKVPLFIYIFDSFVPMIKYLNRAYCNIFLNRDVLVNTHNHGVYIYSISVVCAHNILILLLLLLTDIK